MVYRIIFVTYLETNARLNEEQEDGCTGSHLTSTCSATIPSHNGTVKGGFIWVLSNWLTTIMSPSPMVTSFLTFTAGQWGT